MGQLWDHFGSVRDHFGSVVASFWQGSGDFGHSLGYFWLHFGIPKLVLAGFWPPFVFLLARLIWPKFGPYIIPKLYQNGMPVLAHKTFAIWDRLVFFPECFKAQYRKFEYK